jgi:hypothetical protein
MIYTKYETVPKLDIKEKFLSVSCGKGVELNLNIKEYVFDVLQFPEE